MLPRLNISNIPDIIIRRNFEALRDFFSSQTPLLGFKFFTIVFTSAQDEGKYPHNLGFQPKDIIVTSQTGLGDVIFNYDLFDSNNLNITVTGIVTESGPTTVRFFAGTAK